MNRFGIALPMALLGALAAAPVAQAQAHSASLVRPVLVGGSSELDACQTWMRVIRLNPAGDNFVAVRRAPSLSAKTKGRLVSWQYVMGCQTVGEWTGIVYEDPQGSEDLRKCGVSSPIARRAPYNGPCASGWVATRFLIVEAG